MDTLTIRSATTQNLDAVLDLLKDAKLPADDVASIFGENYGVAILNDSIVGAAGVECHGDSGLFRSAVVRRDQRGKGIGRALTENRIEWAGMHGVSVLYLLTATAAGYFARLGFERIPRDSVASEIASTGEFTSLCPSSAQAMRLYCGRTAIPTGSGPQALR